MSPEMQRRINEIKRMHLKMKKMRQQKKNHSLSPKSLVDENNQIVGSINPSKIINTVFGGRKNNN